MAKSPMVRLSKEQLDRKLEFAREYVDALNPATGSLVDPNSNLTMKTALTLGSELVKDFHIQINRRTVKRKIEELHGTESAERYIEWLEDHLIYQHDESRVSPGTPYCASISLYPMLLHGMTTLGGESGPPRHLDSFCGSFVNLVFAASSQLAGAVATVEFLPYFHHFATHDYGADYLDTHPDVIIAKFQQVVYSLNCPAGNRGYQSVFWNISVFDRWFYQAFFEDFSFPDGSKYSYDAVDKLQRFFMEWFLRERTKAMLTFPVLTEASLNLNGDARDTDWADFCADIRSRGFSFFSYNSETVDSLSSCCRLRNAIQGNQFSFTLGFSGIQTGSVGVITLNLNRFIQKYTDESRKSIFQPLRMIIREIHKFSHALREIVREYISSGLLPIYDAGYIDIDRQYSTVGLNGLNEAAESCGHEAGNNRQYLGFCKSIFRTIAEENSEVKNKLGFMVNTELVPAESLGVKNLAWDRKERLPVSKIRKAYNSYIYLPESPDTSITDKFEMHGAVSGDLDGGSALHLNLSQLPDQEFFRWIRRLAAKTGCNYWTTNVRGTVCENCGNIDPRTLEACPKCGSFDISQTTRVIGYLRKIKNFSDERQNEAGLRFYH